MKFLKLKLSAFFIIFTVFTSLGQIRIPAAVGRRIIDRTVDKTVDKAADKAAEKASDRIVDSIFGTSESGTTRTPAQRDSAVTASSKAFGQIMSGIANAAPPASSYSFNASYTMKVITSSKKDAGEMQMKYYFTNEGDYMGAKMESMSSSSKKTNEMPYSMMVFDFSKSSMYTFMENNGQKTYMGIGLNNAALNNYSDEKLATTKYTKTSQTKTILGYLCDGYLLEDGGTKSLIWLSRNSVPVMKNYYNSFKKMNAGAPANGFKMNYSLNSEIENMVMAGSAMLGMETTDSKGEKFTMEVVELKASDSFNFNATAYKSLMAGN